MLLKRICGVLLLGSTLALSVDAQEKSVRPGINDPFQNPDVKKYAETFEGESREVFAKRKEVVTAIGLKPGMAIADIGAGTGLYTRLFASEVGPKGKVYAVDIAQKFLDHIATVKKEAGIKNVTSVLCKPHSAELPAESVDVAFICDTYHHFEFPERTMQSIHTALKPGGRVVLTDFRRVKGQSTDWVMNHVRAGQDVFEQEIVDAGFKRLKEVKETLKDNYFIVFEKAEKAEKAEPKMLFTVIAGYGGVVRLPDAVEQPTKGSKVVFDVTGIAKETGKPVPGLERAAVLLNLAGVSGLKASDLELVVVLHGEATYAALSNEAFKTTRDRPHDSSELIDRLVKAGVKVQVCGQSLARKKLDPKSVRPGVAIAASAMTATLNHQAKGYSYVPAHGQ